VVYIPYCRFESVRRKSQLRTRDSVSRIGFGRVGVSQVLLVGQIALSLLMLEASWNRSNFSWSTFRCKQPNAIFGCKQRIRSSVNDRIGIEPIA
jgi:hypothetical protein